MRHDVADVDNQVPWMLHQHPIQLDRQRPIGIAIAHLIDKPARNLADRHAAAAPIVMMNPRIGNRAEHVPIFVGRVRHMLPERRNHIDLGVVLLAEQVVEHLGDPPGAGVHPRNIGRQQQHPLWMAQIRCRACTTVSCIKCSSRFQPISSARSAIQGMGEFFRSVGV